MSRTVLLVGSAMAGIFCMILVAVLVMQSWSPYPRHRVGGDFAMVDTERRPVTQANLRGRPTALFFGYTSCPDVCPTTLLVLSNAMEKMGRAADRLNVVFITVDPERDTPEQMKLYLSSFDPRIRGFTGTPAQVSAMAQTFHIYARRLPGENGTYTMSHSAFVELFDASGAIQGTIAFGDEEHDVLAKLLALAEPETCHRGLPTLSTLWGSGGITRCGTS